MKGKEGGKERRGRKERRKGGGEDKKGRKGERKGKAIEEHIKKTREPNGRKRENGEEREREYTGEKG